MLSLLGSIYRKIVDVRNVFYDKGIFDSFDLGVSTISIGNITAGGTGKTPLVAYVAGILTERGERVCILTRGYGRKDSNKRVLVSDGEHILADPQHAGDEPLELAQRLLGKAVVIADADRIGAGEWARRRFGATVFVLDDAFQHRKVKRDVDIVCIDATDPFGGGRMLPAGRLREPAENLKRADIVVITRENLVADISNLKSEISALNEGAAIFAAKTRIVQITPFEKFRAGVRLLQVGEMTETGRNEVITGNEPDQRPRPAFAFCGIGNPDNFFGQLLQEGFSLVDTENFRDHHLYTQRDIDRIESRASKSGAEMFLTTVKDAVKLVDLKFEMPCFVVRTDMTIDNAAAFEDLIAV